VNEKTFFVVENKIINNIVLLTIVDHDVPTNYLANVEHRSICIYFNVF